RLGEGPFIFQGGVLAAQVHDALTLQRGADGAVVLEEVQLPFHRTPLHSKTSHGLNTDETRINRGIGIEGVTNLVLSSLSFSVFHPCSIRGWSLERCSWLPHFRHSSNNDATSAVQPVWWLAPKPAPLSPWKYS